jgi:hypothetical protein
LRADDTFGLLKKKMLQMKDKDQIDINLIKTTYDKYVIRTELILIMLFFDRKNNKSHIFLLLKNIINDR